ncbi:dTDP-4-dehydrorhamnose 3,5-epimerase [Polaribacter porphyrae]|uniref:dTDP-4-dehydrorhamnose 3,5-epimerase n=1 Tax=Polaribacter porphyrae TaxID=1137780 RepID=A0A2S7WS36_9FLAO|nr:dTDP-4-dehydrorhamnose 3,5-epimerase [Polaribacter porphyrae]PQJ80408.1 dTDP-4-dehydrorhamnose 3,5-epimerase [Polaribacter porphyrae]
MKVTETFLKGCFIIEPLIYKDNRGCFFESFNHQKFEKAIGQKINFVQDNQSFSKKGVIRALHMQREPYAQAKLVRVIKGRVLDVAVDVRKGSLTYGKYFSIELSEENNTQLFVPKGFLHGFSTIEDNTIFAYKCDNYYNKDFEYGVIYNDKDLNIDWKIDDDIILSDKDKELPLFEMLL